MTTLNQPSLGMAGAYDIPADLVLPAALQVCGRADDAVEARALLDMLGIGDLLSIESGRALDDKRGAA